MRLCTYFLAVVAALAWVPTGAGAAPPVSPHIDCVDMLPEQPQQKDPDTIWYDDFDTGDPRSRYYEYGDNDGEFVPVEYERYGSRGRCLRARFQKGEQTAGSVKVFFGDNPAATKEQLLRRPGEHFREVYWRFYLKHQRGWQKPPAKLSRATILAGPNWSQAMIAHHWSSGNVLTLDPASGIKNNRLVTKRYNDFENLEGGWLGNKPVGKYPIFSTKESGHWVCVECYVKLNTPGRKDGVFTAWLDGRMDATRTNLNWVGTWRKYGVNAVFLENYWNRGSVREQERYFDNFVISTKSIGPVATPTNPTIIKTPFEDPDPGDTQSAWQVEVASDPDGRRPVWVSAVIEGEGNQVALSAETGKFLGGASGRTELPPDKTYWARVRQRDSRGAWSKWSHWHANFRTAAE